MRPLLPFILLTVSNVFMTIAWYGHLKFKGVALPLTIVASWGIAFVEYCFQVPANRIGSDSFSPYELKTIQEIISLIVFCGFAVTYFKEPVRWNHAVGFVFIALAAFFIFKRW